MAGGTVAENRPPLADNRILHNGQYVAMVVGATLEQAQYGAGLVRIKYAPAAFTVDLEQAAATKFSPKEFMGEPLTFERGSLKQGLSAADVTIQEIYTTPAEHPCPLEPHAAVASWADAVLTVHNASQWVYGDRAVL